MEANDSSTVVSNIANRDLQMPEGAFGSKDVGEIKNALEVSSEVEITLAYISEKLANLENLLLHVLAGEIDIGAIDVENDSISSDLIEKVFTFDILYALLDSELKEMENLMTDLQDLIVDSLRKVSSHEHSTELLGGLVNKLHDSEELLKQSQERVLEMKIQLVKFQMTSFSSKQYEWRPELRSIEQKRTLRMLKKSLAREMELEKKLTELKQNEEDFKLKIRLTEQVAVSMEEAAEVAWGRFLEADNMAEVFMGISKEIMGKLQNVDFTRISSTKRESEISSKLQDCIHQLNTKEILIQKLNNTIEHLVTDNAEVTGLREKVQMLEEKLKLTESRLDEANALTETSQQQIKEMEGEIESLRDKLYAAANRAETAEEKTTHLTETNLELTEELDFLKGSNDSNTKKVSLLEKQLRELDSQLQHSRASSEASQEQQNMLYTAIWDMETLIDELKQKVTKAESKAENAEEKCIILSETNSELSKELEFQRSRVEFMDTSLNQASVEKRACADDISIKTSLIMSTVAQLAIERECIEKKLISLTMGNKLLKEKLHKEQKHTSVNLQNDRRRNEKKFLSSGLDSANSETAKTSAVKATEISSENSQVDKSSDDAYWDENKTGASSSENDSSNLVLLLEAKKVDGTGNGRRTFISMTILVLLLSVLAGHLLHKRLAIVEPTAG